MLVLGCTHLAQLWLQPLAGAVVFTAVFGAVYWLVGLGLAGQSRFALWMGMLLPALGSYAAYLRYHLMGPAQLTLAHIAACLLVSALCAATLYRTRHAAMD